ncbi:hypothetical protein QBC40DRAFT_281309, partial [Triangularia verruculosa]
SEIFFFFVLFTWVSKAWDLNFVWKRESRGGWSFEEDKKDTVQYQQEHHEGERGVTTKPHSRSFYAAAPCYLGSFCRWRFLGDRYGVGVARIGGNRRDVYLGRRICVDMGITTCLLWRLVLNAELRINVD